MLRKAIDGYGLDDETVVLLAAAVEALLDEGAKGHVLAMRLRSMLAQLLARGADEPAPAHAPGSLTHVVVQLFEERARVHAAGESYDHSGSRAAASM
ncbi:hypothetical protein HT102_07750 [Hoyosella sp. G463]|uniref:Uncharacterized protein n=1 Tax=Lolliginicoccus lacisalsi TaxID=2742202 RepID=A0A927PL38_9ACTN|nr:hypothetical protein [Lolliginicoccus lacisalsi]MBD8506373.1 hypothetical protein [Lolliginicoccus lacisalsi]